MQNGQAVNGAGAQPQMMQVNPVQAAALALQFLARAPTTRAERESYDLAEALLQAITSGQVVLTTPPQAKQEPAAEPAAPLS